jgi:hypothetical protein
MNILALIILSCDNYYTNMSDSCFSRFINSVYESCECAVCIPVQYCCCQPVRCVCNDLSSWCMHPQEYYLNPSSGCCRLQYMSNPTDYCDWWCTNTGIDCLILATRGAWMRYTNNQYPEPAAVTSPAGTYQPLCGDMCRKSLAAYRAKNKIPYLPPNADLLQCNYRAYAIVYCGFLLVPPLLVINCVGSCCNGALKCASGCGETCCKVACCSDACIDTACPCAQHLFALEHPLVEKYLNLMCYDPRKFNWDGTPKETPPPVQSMV